MMKRAARGVAFAVMLLVLAPALPTVRGQAPGAAYLPREGRRDPALKAQMTKLLAARGIRPVEIRIIEPEWQVERAPDDGAVRARTINAAVVYRGAEGAGLLMRYVLFRSEPSRGRGLRFDDLFIADLGKPRPLAKGTVRAPGG
jgi:hypothetical protein